MNGPIMSPGNFHFPLCREAWNCHVNNVTSVQTIYKVLHTFKCKLSFLLVCYLCLPWSFRPPHMRMAYWFCVDPHPCVSGTRVFWRVWRECPSTQFRINIAWAKRASDRLVWIFVVFLTGFITLLKVIKFSFCICLCVEGAGSGGKEVVITELWPF